MEAIEQQLINRRSDFVFRGFDQAKTQVAWGIFYSVEIARQLPLRRGDENAAGVRKLICRLIEVITKTDGICYLLYVRFISRQKMPTAGSSRTLWFRQIVDVSFLLGRGEFWCFARIETYGNHLELFSGFESHHLKRCHHAVQHLVAQHWTLVVDE